MHLLSWTALDLVVLATIVHLIRRFLDHRRRRGLQYVPGPKGLPVIGNLLDVSAKEGLWLTYDRLGKSYGDMYSLEVLGQRILVLQTHKAVADLFEKRGQRYSDRIIPTMLEMAGYSKWFLSLLHPDASWRLGRRTLDRALRPSALVQYQPVQRRKALDFCQQLLHEPADFVNHIKHLGGAVIMALAYGYDVESSNDKLLKSGHTAVDVVAVSLLPGALLVNILPSLRHIPKWVPGLSYKPMAKYAFDVGQTSIYGPWNFVKNEMAKGTARPSVARDELSEQQFKTEEEEHTIVGALGTMFAAGSDTTTSVLETLFLMLCLYPEVQSRAQAELESVTKGERLPTFADRTELHYINALCRELTRWRIVTPIGVPHATSEDDIYEGYFVPKGTLVVANALTILQDPAVYPEPHVFRPERYMTEEGCFKDDPWLSIAFGGGKRICPGRFIVDNTVFITVSLVLSVFNVSKPKGTPHGLLEGNENVGDSIVTRPQPFACSIVPRSKSAVDILLATVSESSESDI
ncbi:cytochrome P450 [Auriscalpium vulgare]|uniref:Cytochrome P450 n=1 Tax=Auriscalpium vulgare TaxID=40419 RepID=A0ACB8S7S3_9AGAM|nr:cytochrome P450 [Auriscalpium vulgare]